MNLKMVKFLQYILCFGLIAIFFSFDVPKGWFIAGDKASSYYMGIAKGEGRNKGTCAVIKSLTKKINGFGTLMQSSRPKEYIGKRLKMTGYVKSKDVQKWAGMFLRADVGEVTVSIDDMEERPIKGETDWKKYEIVIDVPPNSSRIAYGILMFGPGQVWLDDFSFEVVSENVPVTSTIHPAPVNLNFEE